jgi:endonuclease/exonuclease/phosphatase family metal-dependent hydrolase
LRVVTYNVHRCRGGDGVLSPSRIAEVLASQEPDVIALQELDTGHARTGHADQPALVADYLKMHCYFYPAVERLDERYGDAVLSRHPMELVRAGPLPTLPHRPRLERRGALWVRLDCGGRPVQLLNTHLGFWPAEHRAQVEALLGPDWLGHPDCRPPRLLCGDLNFWPGTRPYRRVRQVLRDAQDRHGPIALRPTYPARLPVLCLDYVFHSHDLMVRSVRVPRTRLTRVASDHLPVGVEVALP